MKITLATSILGLMGLAWLAHAANPLRAPFSGGGVNLVGTIDPNAFYVATTGSDSNPGTLAQPFLTLGQCLIAMRPSTTKTCYLRAGVYNLTQSPTSSCFLDALDLYQAGDTGQVWSYYPPDGYNTAILDGGSTGPGVGLDDAFCIHNGVTSVTINGIQFRRFKSAAVYLVDGNNSVLKNNIIHDITMQVTVGLGGISSRNSANLLISNNYIYNTRDNGVAIHGTISGRINGTIIENNFVYNTCTAAQDCGALYTEDEVLPSSTGVIIRNNYIRDTGLGLTGNGYIGGVGIYLDAGVDGTPGSSNETITGNVITGAHDFCFQNHGGENNTFNGNICDLSTGGNVAILYHQNNPLGPSPMAGNVVSHNIIIAGASGAAGLGYIGDSTAANPAVISNNAYHNYVGTSVVSTGSGGAGSDSSPVAVNPQITCWSYNVAPGSPVFSAPVSFPGIVGGWGPPGFVVTQVGTPPSSPHAC